LPSGFHLVISATEMDKRRSFYKTLQKAGEIVECGGTDKWGKVDMEQLESFAQDKARAFGKTIADGALQSLLALTGGNYRAVASEVQKLATYIGERQQITEADVSAIGSPSAESLPWDLLDAIGERNLSRALEVLHRLLFQGENEIGLLFALVGRIRTLLLLRELMDRKLVPASTNYGWFQSNLQRVAEQVGDELPADKKLNPLLQHPFVVFKSAQQAQSFSLVELQRAMELLLDANKRLVSSSIDAKIVLEQTIIALIQPR
jgi:DNA polymerase-3 subunit delta